jgi:hypothetical protein
VAVKKEKCIHIGNAARRPENFSMPSDHSLHDFCLAFESKDFEKIAALFDPKGLCEFPLFGQRLMGHGEIREGFMRAFSVIDSSSITFQTCKSGPNATIAEGRLEAKLYRDHHSMAAPLALVMVKEAGRIARLSCYLDARPFRLWCDGPVFGPSPSGSRGEVHVD